MGCTGIDRTESGHPPVWQMLKPSSPVYPPHLSQKTDGTYPETHPVMIIPFLIRAPGPLPIYYTRGRPV
jgi:hypothetical protein